MLEENVVESLPPSDDLMLPNYWQNSWLARFNTKTAFLIMMIPIIITNVLSLSHGYLYW